jgi:hypothetical protein
VQVSLPNGDGDPRLDCVRCRAICHLSAVICRCAPSRRKVACLRHGGHLCGCPPAARMLVYWAGLEEVAGLAGRAAAAATAGRLPLPLAPATAARSHA